MLATKLILQIPTRMEHNIKHYFECQFSTNCDDLNNNHKTVLDVNHPWLLKNKGNRCSKAPYKFALPWNSGKILMIAFLTPYQYG